MLDEPGSGRYGLYRSGMDTAPALSDEAAAAWARASIYLNRGDVAAAQAAAVEASALTGDWDGAFGDYSRYSGPAVYDTVVLPSGWVWVEPGPRRVLLSQSVMSEFGYRSALANFTRTVVALMVEPGFRSISVDSWRQLRPGR